VVIVVCIGWCNFTFIYIERNAHRYTSKNVGFMICERKMQYFLFFFYERPFQETAQRKRGEEMKKDT